MFMTDDVIFGNGSNSSIPDILIWGIVVNYSTRFGSHWDLGSTWRASFPAGSQDLLVIGWELEKEPLTRLSWGIGQLFFLGTNLLVWPNRMGRGFVFPADWGILCQVVNPGRFLNWFAAAERNLP